MRRLDPRVKLVVALLFSSVLALAERPATFAVAIGFAVGLLLACRPPMIHLLRRVAALNVFMLLVWLTIPLTVPGDPVWSVGPVYATAQGIEKAAALTAKTNGILLALTALLATSPIVSLTHAMSHLRMPNKLVQLFYFTWRYIQEVEQEYNRLRTAMRVRCFAPKTDLHTYRTVAYLLGGLLIRGLDRSERVYQAMVLRGFKGWLPAFDHPLMRASDGCWLAFFLIIVALMGWIEWMPSL